MRPTATIQLTTIELVIGKPKGLAISTAFCDGPCSTCWSGTAGPRFCSRALAEITEAFCDSAFTAKAQSASEHMNAAVQSSNISLGFTLDKTSKRGSIQADSPSNMADVTQRSRFRNNDRIRLSP